jgi:hypothetical protein
MNFWGITKGLYHRLMKQQQFGVGYAGKEDWKWENNKKPKKKEVLQ